MAKKGTVRLDGVEWDFASLWGNAFSCYPERMMQRRDYIFASEVGQSFRDRYLKMFAHPFSNPFNQRSKAKMMAGRFFEDVVGLVLSGTGMLKERQQRVRVELPGCLPVSGKLDFVAGGTIDWEEAERKAAEVKRLFMASSFETSDFVCHMIDHILPHFKNVFGANPAREYVLEAKSVSGFVFNLIDASNKPRQNHPLQLLTYLIPKDTPKHGMLQYISREDVMMKDFLILPEAALLKQYHDDVQTMTMYYNNAGKNYLKNLPPLEPEVIFEEASFRFVKSNSAEYSSYLTYNYGYANIDEFKAKWDSRLSKWNRVFKRAVKGETITKANIEIINDAKTVFPDWDNYVHLAQKAGAFSKPEEMEDEV